MKLPEPSLSLVLPRVLKYLDRRERTEHEVRGFLEKIKVDPSVWSPVLARLKELKLVDDGRYVEMVLRASSGKGALYFQAKLAQRGIFLEVMDIDKILAKQNGNVPTLDKIRGLLDRKYAAWKDDPKIWARAFRAMLASGFSEDEVQSVMGEG